jgi:hypothetical protein
LLVVVILLLLLVVVIVPVPPVCDRGSEGCSSKVASPVYWVEQVLVVPRKEGLGRLVGTCQ